MGEEELFRMVVEEGEHPAFILPEEEEAEMDAVYVSKGVCQSIVTYLAEKGGKEFGHVMDVLTKAIADWEEVDKELEEKED